MYDGRDEIKKIIFESIGKTEETERTFYRHIEVLKNIQRKYLVLVFNRFMELDREYFSSDWYKQNEIAEEKKQAWNRSRHELDKEIRRARKAGNKRRVYYLKHREEILRKQREKYRQNREKYLAKSKRYKEANKEKVAQYNKEYFQKWYPKNKERVSKQKKEYYQKNRERILAKRREKNEKQ